MIIDVHVHACRPRHPGIARPNGTAYPTPERAIEMMDAAGIDRAALMCSVSPEFRYTLVTPEETLGIARQYPDRFIPFCNMDPRFVANSPDADFRPLLAAYKELGCKGVGEYIPNIPFDDPLNMNFFGQVEEAGLPLTFHISAGIGKGYGCFDEPGLPRLEKVLEAFPNLVLLGHSQPFWAEIGTNVVENGVRVGYPEGPVEPGRLPELMRRHPNLHGDLSARSGFNALSRDPEFGRAFMEEFQDRLCFGTDIANDPQALPIVSFFRSLRDKELVSLEAWEKIAHRNAERLFGIQR